jgi:ubiquinone/menaquinone biosynthesis C-methylase UbiE
LQKNERGKRGLFDKIAPIYGWFYGYQKWHYRGLLERVQDEVDLSRYKRIIDVGCGTGALCSVLHQRGFVVTGVDPALQMLKIAGNKRENRDIEFIQASALERMPFADKSFDVSIACYVAHGLRNCERKVMYAEMSRVTKHRVIVYDYNDKRSLLTSIIERLEGGDYFNFIKVAKAEMEESFHEVQVLNVGPRGAWYIGVPRSDK